MYCNNCFNITFPRYVFFIKRNGLNSLLDGKISFIIPNEEKKGLFNLALVMQFWIIFFPFVHYVNQRLLYIRLGTQVITFLINSVLVMGKLDFYT